MTCACGTPLGRGNKSGRCRACNTAWLNSNPAIREERNASIRRRYRTDPIRLQVARNQLNAVRNTVATATPEQYREWGVKGNAARPKGSPSRMRAGARQVATKLADIPRERHADYLHLTKVKRVKADEAKAMILEEHQRQMSAFAKKLIEATA